MNRSLWPEGVIVDEVVLANESTNRAAEILTGRLDTTTRGVESGLVVTVNGGDATKVDISAGYGYAPNGEIVTLINSHAALTLSDYTLGTQNYICLVYTEQYSRPEPHETLPSTFNTIATRASRIVVLTAAQYNALPSTSTDLTVNAKDRIVVPAIIVANGVAVNLTVGSIQLPTTFINIAAVSNGPTPAITGLTLLSVDPTTPAGTASIAYSSGVPYQLKYTAPGDVNVVYTNISSDGTYTLASTNGRTCTISVILASLPAGTGSSTISITSLYSTLVPRNSAEDLQHRNMLGTGKVTTKNPHGLSIADVGGTADAAVIVHQELMHANGIWAGSPSNALQVSVDVGAGPNQYKQILINALTGGSLAFVNGIDVNTSTPGVATFAGIAGTDQELYGVYLDDGGDIVVKRRAAMQSSSLLQAGLQIVGASPNIPAGTKTLFWSTGISPFRFTFDSGPAYTIDFATDGGVAGVVRMFGLDPVNSWIDVYVDPSWTGWGGVPTTTTETITFDTAANARTLLPLAWVTCSGTNFGTFVGYGYGGFPHHNPNGVVDLRIFGSTSDVNLQPGPFELMPYINDEILGSMDHERRRLASQSLNGANGSPPPSFPGLPEGSYGLQCSVSNLDVTPIIYVAPGVCSYDPTTPNLIPNPDDTITSPWVNMMVAATQSITLDTAHATLDRYDFIKIVPNRTTKQYKYKKVWDPRANGGTGGYSDTNVIEAIFDGATVTKITGTPGAAPTRTFGAGVLAMIKVPAASTTLAASNVWDWRWFERSTDPVNHVIRGATVTVTQRAVGQSDITIGAGDYAILGQRVHDYTGVTLSTDGGGGHSLIPTTSGSVLTTRGWVYLWAVRRPSQRGHVDYILGGVSPQSGTYGPFQSGAFTWPDGWVSAAGEGTLVTSLWCDGASTIAPMSRKGEAVKITTPQLHSTIVSHFPGLHCEQTLTYANGSEADSFDLPMQGWGQYFQKTNPYPNAALSNGFINLNIRVNDQNTGTLFKGPPSATRMVVDFSVAVEPLFPDPDSGLQNNAPKLIAADANTISATNIAAGVAVGTFASDSVVDIANMLTPALQSDPNVVDYHQHIWDNWPTRDANGLGPGASGFHNLGAKSKIRFQLNLKSGQVYWMPMGFSTYDPTGHGVADAYLALAFTPTGVVFTQIDGGVWIVRGATLATTLMSYIEAR